MARKLLGLHFQLEKTAVKQQDNTSFSRTCEPAHQYAASFNKNQHGGKLGVLSDIQTTLFFSGTSKRGFEAKLFSGFSNLSHIKCYVN